MNRLFDDARRGGLSAPGAQAGGQGVPLAPHMDVSETEKEVRIQAGLPGVSKKGIEVSLTDDVLSIRAEKQQAKKAERQGTHFSERAHGTFRRSLRLPFPVGQDQVQANFENGVLTATLPKAQPQDRSRRIQVQGTQPKGSIRQAGRRRAAKAARAPKRLASRMAPAPHQPHHSSGTGTRWPRYRAPQKCATSASLESIRFTRRKAVAVRQRHPATGCHPAGPGCRTRPISRGRTPGHV